AALARLEREEPSDPGDERAQIDALALERDAHGPRARDVEQPLRHVFQSQHVLVHGVDERTGLLVERAVLATQELGRHAERGERRAELVREGCDELLAAGLLIA